MIRIDPKRNFSGKPLGSYDPANDAFAKYKGKTPPANSPNGKISDWSGLDLNNVETMVQRSAGVTAWDALAEAKKQGKVIVPNSVHDRMLVETEHWKKDSIKAGYAAWTGTAIIYEAPDTPLGEKVVFKWEDDDVEYSLEFVVPERFRGKENCALLINHPDFEIVPLTGRANSYEIKVADESAIRIVENFGKESQKWYKYDEKTRVPVGDPLDVQQADNTVRYLWRRAGTYCGLLARGYVGGRQGVDADGGPSVGLGVHVVPLADAPEKE